MVYMESMSQLCIVSWLSSGDIAALPKRDSLVQSACALAVLTTVLSYTAISNLSTVVSHSHNFKSIQVAHNSVYMLIVLASDQ